MLKRILWVLAAAFTLLSCSPKVLPSASAPSNKAAKVVAALHDPASKYVVVVSHRGDWRNYPENSIPAIESVIRMGVDVMELDLKLTKDSVLVLSHDKTLDRMTTGTGLVSDYTYEELMALQGTFADLVARQQLDKNSAWTEEKTKEENPTEA